MNGHRLLPLKTIINENEFSATPKSGIASSASGLCLNRTSSHSNTSSAPLRFKHLTHQQTAPAAEMASH